MKGVELFAGAGGLGLGLASAGVQPLAVIEWNQYCCDTLRENQRQGHSAVREWPLMQEDVRSVDFRAFEGEVDLVSGGPPCQPFSIAGKHKGYADSRDMFPQAVRAVREIKPRAFIFENVKGLTRSTFADYFGYVRLQLSYPLIDKREDEQWWEHLARLEAHHTAAHESDLEYRLVTRVLNAADYGVPQKRERVFFVGIRADLGIEWSFPRPTHSLSALLHDKFVTGSYWARHQIHSPGNDAHTEKWDQLRLLNVGCELKPWVTVRDALCDLPDPEIGSGGYHNHRLQLGARSYVGHTGSLLDEPAKTLKAGDHGVPGGENMMIKEDGSVRYFTVRESARIQTFPDDFVFHGSWTETMRQLGNAVPVQLASAVAYSVRELIA